MAWKQSLAQIKKELREEPVPPPKSIRPKVESEPVDRPIEDEDALFLSVMGGRTRPVNPPAPGTAPRPRPEPAPEDPAFESAMSELKGLKPVAASPLMTSGPAMVPPPAPKPDRTEPLPEPSMEPSPAPAPPPTPAAALTSPLRIHLAAGMAVEVDGTLDLRGHTVHDARERLLERIQDGVFLGWRTLHVTLGPEEALQAMILELLLQGPVPDIARFAQAPIPMGGSQAWILYFATPTHAF